MDRNKQEQKDKETNNKNTRRKQQTQRLLRRCLNKTPACSEGD